MADYTSIRSTLSLARARTNDYMAVGVRAKRGNINLELTVNCLIFAVTLSDPETKTYGQDKIHQPMHCRVWKEIQNAS